jgi:hypothetical protein
MFGTLGAMRARNASLLIAGGGMVSRLCVRHRHRGLQRFVLAGAGIRRSRRGHPAHAAPMCYRGALDRRYAERSGLAARRSGPGQTRLSHYPLRGQLRSLAIRHGSARGFYPGHIDPGKRFLRTCLHRRSCAQYRLRLHPGILSLTCEFRADKGTSRLQSKCKIFRRSGPLQFSWFPDESRSQPGVVMSWTKSFSGRQAFSSK